MKYVYNLDHVHEQDGMKEISSIGFFSTLEKIEQIIDELICKPGFNKYPRENFVITKMEIDHIYWADGFE